MEVVQGLGNRSPLTMLSLIKYTTVHVLVVFFSQVGRPNNVPQAAALIVQIQEEAAKYPRIYIASIHPDLTSDDVRRYLYLYFCVVMYVLF